MAELSSLQCLNLEPLGSNLSSEDVVIEALFLAVRVSQAPKNSKEVALCEQVYNLKRYPRELRPYNSMASKKER